MRYLIIGAGPAGCTAARALAEGGADVTVWEKRPHIAGNTYDEADAAGVLVHRYGPHIFHTKDEAAYAFLSRFTGWYPLAHRVLADVHGRLIPVPFNLVSLRLLYPADEAVEIERRLIAAYGRDARVSILELRRANDAALRALAEVVYENVFLHYTVKQWGSSPDEIDPATLARVPVLVSEDCRYFQDPHQGLPAEGYTAMFARMLDHSRIRVELNCDAMARLRVEGDGLWLDGAPAGDVTVLYTGALDELFGRRLGALPYRTLDFAFETLPREEFQPVGVVNYTVDQPFTRITEFKKLTGQRLPEVTTIVREYPRACGNGDLPYYPIQSTENRRLYDAYAALLPRNVLPLGRLAEYRYYNIDAIVSRALALANGLIGGQA